VTAPIRILIVEDESIVALDLANSLETMGYSVVGRVARGLDAIQSAVDLRPDLVLMDIHLKGEMDGIEAAEVIRARCDIPIIFLTAHADAATLQRARVTEPFGYLLKPFDDRALDSNILIALYKHAAEQKLRQSEAQYRTLFETMAQGVVYHAADGKIVSVNPAAERILGLSQDQLLGLTSQAPHWRAIHPDGSDFPGEEHPGTVALRTGKEVRNVIMGIYNPQKEDYVWISVNARPLFAAGRQEPDQVFTTFEDITAIQKAEAQSRISEERYRILVETSADAVTLTDMHGHILTANRQALKVFGFRSQEEMQICDYVFFDLAADLDRPRLRESVRKAIQEDAVQFIEYTALMLDGSVVPLETSISVVKDAKNQPYALLEVSRDITERKKAESELRLLSQAVAQSANVIVITDPQGNIVYVNPRFEELTGYTAEEARHQNPRVLKSGEQSREFYKELWDTIKSGRIWRGEFHNKRKDGSLFWEWATIAPVIDAQGTITHYIAIKEDITARKAIEDAEREQRQLAEALRISAEALSSTLKYEDVLERILNNVGLVVPYDAVAIVLVENRKLRVVRHRGWLENGRGEIINSSDLKLEDFPGLQAMYDSQQQILVADIPPEAHLAGFPDTHWVRSFAGVPISSRDQVTGFLVLLSNEPNFFQPIHTSRLAAFASQAAMAIENARLFEQTHYYSITDGLTGLYNSRYFFNLASFEFERSRRYTGNLSVLMLDLDWFKLVNDHYGHPVGDQVLRQVALLIMNSLRKADVVARYGGEEFVVLMPETNLQEACQVAERIRELIANTPLRVEEYTIPITVSIGTAKLEAGQTNFNALVKCADDALYMAKAAGRNRVAVWGEQTAD
jgi:diguanylate cyclase (GGDEF)-like protein/PAS domain S-box-containing protein